MKYDKIYLFTRRLTTVITLTIPSSNKKDGNVLCHANYCTFPVFI